MSDLSSSTAPPASELSREEFEEFINLLTHEIRNRLNIVGLEASDLAEQSEGDLDVGRLQSRLRECSEFLKRIRDLLVPEGEAGEKIPLARVIATLRGGPEGG